MEFTRLVSLLLKKNVNTAKLLDQKNAIIVQKALEKIEQILNCNKYFHGEQLTETDIRLFTTIVRHVFL